MPATPTDHATAADGLAVGGVTGFSTCDWPGELVATVFCQGCPWDCGYCHNPHLRAAGPGPVAWTEVLARLRTRIGLLDGVVFSGGEPTLQAKLPAAIRAVRDLGFRVGLHTAGPYPDRLAAVLDLVDWVGFDAKAPFDRYPEITGVPDSGLRARESLRRVLAAGIACEVRTTVHPALLDAGALTQLADELVALGVRDYAAQAFRPTGCRPDFVQAHAPLPLRLPSGLEGRFARFTVRG
ncbi:anaerobic ribonucleoside-triphosphate reductase activating protein [Rhodovastum atsumiense]|uniref:Anaerobic ribonucleoside-triphosphate reductase activating protein n=1 Tax=Rhodovastum atsumiense TaxID=504468 RepID=A0A5M6J3U7_9PROT|nr:anaerobic ribonucleoside-triphosphate reductase activating protein [Rhodovastum atsumiense]